MSDLTALGVNDPIVVHDSQNRYSHRKVARVGRIWLTDDYGDKFRIADGKGEERMQYGHGHRAVTVAEWELAEETSRLSERLVEWGWIPSMHGKRLTLGQMRRAAALLAEFEAEATGGLL